MKKINTLVFAFMLILPCFIFGGCGENELKISANIDKYSVDIANASGLGVATIDNQVKLVKNTPSLKTAKSLVETNDPEIDFIPSFEEVKYFDKTGNPTNIDSSLELYQFNATNDFTYVSYISSNIRKKVKSFESMEAYGETYYRFNMNANIYDITRNCPYYLNEQFQNTEYIHCYIIHNATGKIYDSAQVFQNIPQYYSQGFTINKGVFTISNGSALSGSLYLSVNQDNELEVKKYVSNLDVTVSACYKDADGYSYVINNILEEYDEKTKTSYIIPNNTTYYYGSDNYVYCSIGDTYKRMQGSSIIDIPSNTVTHLNANNWPNGGYINNGLRIVYQYSTYRPGTIVYSVNGECLMPIQYEHHYDFENNLVFKHINNTLYVYTGQDLNNGELGEAKKLLEKCTLFKPNQYANNQSFVFKKVTADRTISYILTKDTDTGELCLKDFADVTYDTGLIVKLKPIN